MKILLPTLFYKEPKIITFIHSTQSDPPTPKFQSTPTKRTMAFAPLILDTEMPDGTGSYAWPP